MSTPTAATTTRLLNPATYEHHILEHQGDLHAPHLLDVELLSAVRRLVATGAATTERAGDAVRDFQDLTIERYGHEPLISRAWALRENFSSYDAVYVALAEGLADEGVPLLTADRRLARAIEQHLDLEPVLVG